MTNEHPGIEHEHHCARCERTILAAVCVEWTGRCLDCQIAELLAADGLEWPSDPLRGAAS